MALSSATVLEVRTAGVDTNGGGFVTGATGTDFSQQNAAQYSGTNLACAAGTTNPSVITSATHNFVAADVGNLIQITAGTNWTTGFYQIVSVAANAATLDRAVGTAVSLTNGTFAVGGALLTISKALAIMTITGMQTYVKAGTYSIASGLSTSAGINTAVGFARLIGYNTSRGDLAPPTALTRPVIQASANLTGLTDNNGGFRIENFTFDGNSKVGTSLDLNGAYTVVYNCIIKNWAPTGNGALHLGADGVGLYLSEVTANAGSDVAIYANGTVSFIVGNYVHDNASSSADTVFLNGRVIVEDNIFATNSGATATLFNNFIQATVRRNVFYNNSGSGIGNPGAYALEGEISNNIFVNNAGWGINLSTASPVRDDCMIHHNAYFGNVSGARNGSNAGVGDVTLTASPFVNPAGGDYSLNQTVGAGGACRSAGYPGQMIGGGTGYMDIGILQGQQNILVGRVK
jgi:hypothetical protein